MPVCIRRPCCPWHKNLTSLLSWTWRDTSQSLPSPQLCCCYYFGGVVIMMMMVVTTAMVILGELFMASPPPLPCLRILAPSGARFHQNISSLWSWWGRWWLFWCHSKVDWMLSPDFVNNKIIFMIWSHHKKTCLIMNMTQMTLSSEISPLWGHKPTN